MLDLIRLIDLANKSHKIDFMAKEAPTSKVVVRVNIVEYGRRFFAILSGGLLESKIVGVDITDDMEDFNEVIRPLGYKWDQVLSDIFSNLSTFDILLILQKFISEGGDRRRLLLSKI